MTDHWTTPTFSPTDRAGLARLFGDLVVGAGALAMEVLARPNVESRLKDDKSPVTEADERVEDYLLAALARDLPGVPIIAEEAAARGETAPHGEAFLLIDPIDGTREFLARSPEFTVNLALVVDGAPVAGAISAPAGSKVWFGGVDSFMADAAPGGALPASQDWRRLHTRKAPAQGMTALVSKSHLDPETEAFVARLPVAERMSVGSSLKFCAVAEGRADVYPRFGPTMEWDTAAGDAILRAAGGVVLDPSGTPLRYNKSREKYRNGPFIVWGDPASATLS
ncbi:3'(2'),5'-bisphosphate nucleotidase CysQ [Methylocystis sp. MJC1]|jgi:3'(2'), 5'-bisphosphate nucleotidase|uniref:3'(2'),5'-bisphosphate nucleotidase CysQ n=1 Tax=Methylocystis sp. MJC1 TaxID=2654282 RepID=UPI0013EB7043|nr:3'(2'),5'-bisphosphate nucleotidase CysQ [Methylocystis sp. MJC1]KAF2990337.1 3'(2'),5'-bisphosphate nucleotidase CysQ [Methylocystis sp. MJC1]MBU6528137.1 3'(2'),5'-bisphosphate nucleotidase CysQ [Methylocystis sp. MJC1]UZX11049.1 3'(2'),5'-bisphosphate nucleotidase CysQ [Methylocystis sp. MJC1]